MPNGRSGGFLIETGTLVTLLETLPSSTTLGFSVGSATRARGAGEPRPLLNATDVVGMARTFKWPHVYVEEHDYEFYVLHLDRPLEMGGEPDADLWVVVEEGSALFKALREQHQRDRASRAQERMD